MTITELSYPIYEDIMLYLDAAHISLEVFIKKIGLSKTTVQNIKNGEDTSKDVLEKIYSYIYIKKYRLNKVKSEYLKEEKKQFFFMFQKLVEKVVLIETLEMVYTYVRSIITLSLILRFMMIAQ